MTVCKDASKTSGEMSTLIADLEQAEEGSRELDARVWCVLNGTRFKGTATAGGTNYPQVFYTEPPLRRQEVFGPVDAYTTSIDAALQLYVDVPERVPSNALIACVEALKQRIDLC